MYAVCSNNERNLVASAEYCCGQAQRRLACAGEVSMNTMVGALWLGQERTLSPCFEGCTEYGRQNKDERLERLERLERTSARRPEIA